MVVSVQHDASDAGLKMLKAGGNAVDAAVATGFALAVVYPDAGNLGGGGFMMLRLANGESHFLDFREEAPLRATANMYLDGNGKIIPRLPRLAICPSAFRAQWPGWSRRSGALASSRCSK
jgi:gamma-glutamyltranspeptidase/glutathione hydrolase